MLDIKKIKENPDAVKAGLKAKEVDCDAIVDRILELDVQIRGLKTSTETKTAQKNKLAKENGKLFGQKKGAEKKGEDTAALAETVTEQLRVGVCTKVSDLAVSGRDLLDCGVLPGARVGEVLSELLAAVLANPDFNTRENLLSLVRDMMR